MEAISYRIHFVVGLIAVVVFVGVGYGVYAHILTDGGPGDYYRVDVRFRNLAGLKTGGEVRLAGADVGIVEAIQVDAPTERHPLPAFRVTLKIANQEDYRRWIRSDSRFVVTSKGLLGDSLVEVTWGTEEGRILQDGELVEGSSGGSLDAETFDALKTTLENVQAVSDELRVALQQDGEGGLQATVANLNHTLANAATITTELQASVQNLNATFENAAQVTENAKNAFGEQQSEELVATLADLRTSAANLKEVSERAKVGVESWIEIMDRMRFWK